MNSTVPHPGLVKILLVLALSASAALGDDGTVNAQHTSTGYRSPGSCVVSCEFAYPTNRTNLGLAWFVSPPSGWQVVSVTGNELAEVNGNDLVFLSSLTNRPIRFSYTLSVPAGYVGTTTLSARAEYSLDNMTNQATVTVTPDPLPLTQQFQVTVLSPYGGTIPPAGTNTYNTATNIVLTVTNSPVVAGETRYVCTGWTGTGSIGAGTGTNTAATITNDSSIEWLWKTQYSLTLSNTAGGTVTAATGWHDAGSNVSVSATAASHYQFSGWSGDTNGCTIAAAQISIPIDGPRHITARFLLDSHSLQISSPYGNPQPPAGTDSYEYGSTIGCSVPNSPVAAGETQYVCLGWTGTGSVVPGVGTNTQVTLTVNSTLAWLWKTQYMFRVTNSLGGSVTQSSGWYDRGGTAQAVASADPHYHFAGWAGATNGCLMDDTRITVPINDARQVQALFELDTHTLTVASAHGGTIPPAGTTSYAYNTPVDCRITNSPLLDGDYRYVCTGWMGSGSVTPGSGTNLQVVLTNNSTLTWTWKTQCWLAVTGGAGGSVTDVSGWYDADSNVTATASPAEHYHFSEWQGATNGCTLNGDRITAPMGAPRAIAAVFALDQHSLEIMSRYGSPQPATGTNFYEYGSTVACYVASSPVQIGTTGYVCTGWTGWGSVLPGSGTNTQVALTNNSGLTWLWTTQFLMTATASTGGTVSLTSGWYDQGGSVVVTATAAAHYHFGRWSGQTNGCTISSNQISLLIDGPRDVAAIFDLDQHTLAVSSKFGTAVPPVGTNVLYYGTNLTCSVIDSPIVNGNLTTQYVCSGWTGSGSVPSTGTKTNTPAITLTNNSSIAWKWATNVWLGVAAGAGGSIKTNVQSGWYTAGSVVSNIEAVASNNYHFTSWSGNTNGCTITTNKISAPMTSTRSLTASFALDDYRLTVSSKYGTPTPPVGTNFYLYGSNTFCAIPDSPVSSGYTQYVCTGWSGSGSVPTNGSTTNTGWFAVTNHSSITWKWGTNYWLGLGNTAGGSLDRTSSWYTAGVSVSNITATPSNHYHFGAWTGDTNGCTISSNRASLTMTRARLLGARFDIDAHRLVVTTPYGTGSPPAGTNLYDYGSSVSAAIVDSPVTAGQTRYVCTGWSGSGSVSGNGTGTNTGPFNLAMDSSVNWAWQTQHLFGVSCDEGGAVQGPAGWQDAGRSITASVTATHGFTFERWMGDVPSGMESNNPIVLTMDQPRTINARILVNTNLIRAAHAAAGYRSPEIGRTITCSFESPSDRTLLALAWLVALPQGWQITSVTGNGSPEVQGSEIVFMGTLLTNRVNFSYTLSIPGNAATTSDIPATADFQLDGMANNVGLPASPTPLRLSRYHSADYRATYWTIDSSEVSRFLSYWRAGGYQVNAGGLDGYMLGAGNTNGGYHSADYLAPRWVMSGTEVNRVLSYWRAGGYHVDPAGNDGYVAGAITQGLGPSMMDAPSFSCDQDGPPTFDPGQTVTISNTCNYSGTLLSLLCRPHLPRGWVITGVTGDGSPEYGLGEIVWTLSMPASPIHFAYTVSIPGAEHGAREIRSEIEYQMVGMANESNTAPTPAILALNVRDADGDGLPDSWENCYGGGVTNLVPQADDDGDGAVNWMECIAGTDPMNSNSVLNVSGDIDGNDNRKVVSWQSVPNRWYTLERCFNLPDGFTPLATNLPATPPLNCYTDTVNEAGLLFYRIEVEP